MANKTFNFYCDESRGFYLEDHTQPYALVGYMSCAYNQTKLHSEVIRQLKAKHHIFCEIKWSRLSKSAYPLYSDLINYFFAADLQYRAIVIDKSGLEHEDSYHKICFQLISETIKPEYNYNIYFDIKDSINAKIIIDFKNCLGDNFTAIRSLQNTRSRESELMQLTDIINGALSYRVRGLNAVIAKNKIIEKIQRLSKHPLTHAASKDHPQFNPFFIDLKQPQCLSI